MFDKFIEFYTEELTKAIIKYPKEYAYPVSEVPVVVSRMAKAFKEGTYNKDGKAIKNTCKRLNIGYTYKDINEYLLKGN